MPTASGRGRSCASPTARCWGTCATRSPTSTSRSSARRDPDDASASASCSETERADYQAALHRHYEHGPPADWPSRFVSAYATTHPWEDWAETFAHYLHIRDTLQTSVAYGVNVVGPAVSHSDEAPLHSFPGAMPDDIRGLLDAWLPMTYALNALNRSMGANDIYPFVLAPKVVEKLGFIDELVRDSDLHAETAMASWIVDD